MSCYRHGSLSLGDHCGVRTSAANTLEMSFVILRSASASTWPADGRAVVWLSYYRVFIVRCWYHYILQNVVGNCEWCFLINRYSMAFITNDFSQRTKRNKKNTQKNTKKHVAVEGLGPLYDKISAGTVITMFTSCLCIWSSLERTVIYSNLSCEIKLWLMKWHHMIFRLIRITSYNQMKFSNPMPLTMLSIIN